MMFDSSDESRGGGSINITPIIDIVFLLIIFFMLVCQYITAENFDVAVPDDISSAQETQKARGDQITVVTVMYDRSGSVQYAVGADIIQGDDRQLIPATIAAAIDSQLQTLPTGRRTVAFRNDQDIPFEYTKYALAGISQSTATDVKWAVIRDKGL